MSTYKDPQTTSIIEEDDDDLLLRAEREKMKAQQLAKESVQESAPATEAKTPAPAPTPTPTPTPAPTAETKGTTPAKSAIQQEYEAQQDKVLAGQMELAKSKDEYFTSMLNLQREIVGDTIKQNDADTRQEARRAKWGAATEAATALANLIGTTAGASHQQYHQYSMDWMKEADKNRRERDKESRTLRSSLMQLQSQQAVQRAQDSLAIENAKLSIAQNKANYELKQSEIAQRGLLAASKQQREDLNKVISIYTKAYTSAQTTAERKAAAKQLESVLKSILGIDIQFPEQIKQTGKDANPKPKPKPKNNDGGDIQLDADGYPVI